MNIYACQETDRGLARCADKVTGREGVSVVVQCRLWLLLNQAIVVNKAFTFGVPLSSCGFK